MTLHPFKSIFTVSKKASLLEACEQKENVLSVVALNKLLCNNYMVNKKKEKGFTSVIFPFAVCLGFCLISQWNFESFFQEDF